MRPAGNGWLLQHVGPGAWGQHSEDLDGPARRDVPPEPCVVCLARRLLLGALQWCLCVHTLYAQVQPRAHPDPNSALLPPVPTDALANKLFGVPEPSTIARSLPTTVPESPNYRNARTPRTPRTPQLKDPTQTPRFYPVVKEGRTIDAKVRGASGRGSVGRV